ncbi:hypothetical protein ACHAWF_006998 [Thalassiosira exigua]
MMIRSASSLSSRRGVTALRRRRGSAPALQQRTMAFRASTTSSSVKSAVKTATSPRVRQLGSTSTWPRSAALHHQALRRSLSSSATAAAAAVAAQQQGDQTSLSPALAVAAAALLVAAAASQERPAQSEALAAVEPHHPFPHPPHHDAGPDAEMRALGKSLQASHERQMVRMAKLLHSLEMLAEEAEKKMKKEEGTREVKAAHDDDDNASYVRITEAELSNISANPQIVWDHIESLKHGAIFGREDVKRICRAAQKALRKEPSLIDLSSRCDQNNANPLKTITVVGDLHGHFEDSLLKVLDMAGRKDGEEGRDQHGSPWNGTGAVVFNGDFVDRGQNSLEVVLALLLLKLAYPDHVYLNRGNHEDSVISTVYGCSDEVQNRYGGKNSANDVWKEFEDVFASLPLAVRTDSAIIMHGGIPCEDFSLDQIANITSEERFNVKSMVEPGPNDKTCKLMQNIMWSDPSPEEGVSPNEERGCGVRYGPDVVRKFLGDNGLKYLIRSHEPVDAGYELLECDEHGMSAVTVFSAASYPGGAGFNYGAIVRLNCDGNGDATFDCYGESGDRAGALTAKEKMSHTFKAFADIVAQSRSALEDEFEYLAETRQKRINMKLQFRQTLPASGVTTAIATSPSKYAEQDAKMITPEQWADAMNYVLSPELPDVDWLSIRKFIAPGDLIDYKKFLNLHCNLTGHHDATQMDDNTRDTIMRNHEAIFKVFAYLDNDGSGDVDREEFCNGIDELKRRNSESVLPFDAEELFDSIDVDGGGTIDLDEFQKAFQACDVPYHVAVMMSLDEDKSGTIDRFEFREGVRMLNARLSDDEKLSESNEDIDRLFDELDESGDGELDTEEFEMFVKNYYPH